MVCLENSYGLVGSDPCYEEAGGSVGDFRGAASVAVRTWLDKHRRFQLHFTPTSSSWLNLVQRWFRELIDKLLRRWVFHSIPDLILSIEEYLDAHNEDPRLYIWTAKAESILAKIARGRIALEEVS